MLTRLFAAIRQLRHPGFQPPPFDRRCLKSNPFDGAPRRRHDDIGLLIIEHEGTGIEFLCRDGRTRAVVRRIDYFNAYPVQGHVIVRHQGIKTEVEYEWHHDGRVIATHHHNWDIVGLADQSVEVAA